ASNPGGTGHVWVKGRFITEDGKIFDSEGKEVKGRKFVPAKLDDNPYLDAEEYKETLKNLDPVERRRLEEGDWSVTEDGEMFKRHWFEVVA
ncbi:hypothetical protein R0K20_19120, partial [Staphylococcus sp. SIMBA_130]